MADLPQLLKAGDVLSSTSKVVQRLHGTRCAR
jgi:hypothetical protein